MAVELQEANPRERKRAHTVHLIGVGVFVLILAAALAGLLGKGPLSSHSAQSGDGKLKVEYSRFIHYQEPVELRIHVASGAAVDGVIRLQLSNAFIDASEIDRIEPEPELSIAGTQFCTHTIRVETNSPAEVKVRFAASRFGRINYEVGLQDAPGVRLSHLVFP
jgi:hypothetical protein